MWKKEENMQLKESLESVILKEKREKFEAFRALLTEYNEKFNLTTIIEEKEVYYKHFLDSCAGAFLFKQGGKGAEIGSGAGFPSIPLKILRDDLSFDLFESVGKKCEFLQVVVDKLGLSGMNIYKLRAEEAATNAKFRERYDHAVARAVARMNTLTEYCLPFVKKGGTFIAYKSGDRTEIEEAENAYKTLGGRLKQVYGYELPENYGARILAVVEKIKETPARYPRGQGRERKSPL